MSQTPYDILVLGAGSGGYAAALRAAQLGLRVALVEADKLGGTCLHRGCIPTKALLHAAELADAVSSADRFGIRATLDRVDMAAVGEYTRGVVDRLYRGLTGLVAARNIDVITGRGRLAGPGTVDVEGHRVSARHVVIATGSRARTLPGLTLGGRVVTSTEALRLDRVPATALVLGGGVIGVELASAWRSLGAAVTVVEAADRLLPAEDPTISHHLEKALRRRGIDVRTRTRYASAEQDDREVRLTTGSGEVLSGDLLLVAVGRGPATDGLGLEEQGVRLDGGFVATDERLRTSAADVFAVGDVVAGPQLAHRGFAHGIFVAEEIAGLAPAPVMDATLPRVAYCEPEVASVGLTEDAARVAHGAVTTLEYNLAGNGRSQVLGTSGLVKIVRAEDGPVVGVHMIGARVSELVGEAQAWVGWEAHPDDVAPLVHAHPTQTEALGEAAMALAGKPLHVHN